MEPCPDFIYTLYVKKQSFLIVWESDSYDFHTKEVVYVFVLAFCFCRIVDFADALRYLGKGCRRGHG